eukprot:SAG31_NODE_6014_length_2214_cov_1.825059_2_plen_200_part_00
MAKHEEWRGWLAVAGGILLHLTLGTLCKPHLLSACARLSCVGALALSHMSTQFQGALSTLLCAVAYAFRADCFSNVASYLVSFMRIHAADAEDYRYADSVWIYAVATVGQACMMYNGGRIEKQIGPRYTVLLGGWVMTAGVALTSVACAISKWLVLLTYGLMFGIGVGTCYSAPFVCAMRWLGPKRVGMTEHSHLPQLY